MAVIHASKENFETEVLKSQKPVIVDFWATWCGPCQMQLPIIDALAEEKPDIKICKVNVDEQQELAAEYGVMSIPTLMVFSDGKAVATEVGVQSKEQLISMLDRR